MFTGNRYGLVFTIVFSALINLLSAHSYARIESWVTTSDRSMLLTKQSQLIDFNFKRANSYPIVVADNQLFQPIEGFGFSLTGGSAEHLIKMDKKLRTQVLKELFTSGAKGGAGLSYIRLTIGASDLNSVVFSYNDLNAGETDLELKKFSLAQDLKDVVPVMKEILSINPDIKVMASPWSAPTWMKTNNNVQGGELKKEHYQVYANYLTKYILAMAEKGINISAITIQNEPLNKGNTPSMQWQRQDQAEFIKAYIGPSLKKAGLKTGIMLFDHNTDRIDYPLALMSDPNVDQYVIGSAFHNYGGDMSSLAVLHRTRPDRNIYFTEQMVREREEDNSLDIAGSVSRFLIGATRNWSRNLILWNLAADPNNKPHTSNGGCPFCQGAITIDGGRVTKNLAFYTVAHASMFVPPRSNRIQSTGRGEDIVSLTQDEENPEIHRVTVIPNVQVLPNVAFLTRDNYIVLIVANDTFKERDFQIQHNGKYATLKLGSGAVGTYRWKANN